MTQHDPFTADPEPYAMAFVLAYLAVIVVASAGIAVWVLL